MDDNVMALFAFLSVVLAVGLLVGIVKYKEHKWRKAGGVKSIKIPDTPPPPEESFQENNDEYDYGHNVSHHTLDGEGDL